MMDLFEDQADAIGLLGFMERVCNSGLFAFDLSTNVLKWSPGMYALLGIRPGSVEPTPELFRSFVHPQDRMSTEEQRHIFENALAFERDVRVILHDGRTRWLSVRFEFVVDQHGKARRVLGVCLDITEQQMKTQSQANTLARFRRTITTVAPVIWTADKAGSTTMTSGWGDVTGRSEAAALGWGWLDLLHPDDRDPTVADWRAACESSRFYEREYRVVTAESEHRLLRATGVRSPRDSGTPYEWSGIVVDVTSEQAASSCQSMTGAQIRAARAILKWSVAELSEASDVSIGVIRRLEEFDDSPPKSDASLAALRQAMSAAGVEFTFDAGQAPGVRPHEQRGKTSV